MVRAAVRPAPSSWRAKAPQLIRRAVRQRLLRTVVVLAAASAGAWPTDATGQDVLHLERRLKWVQGAVSNGVIDGRIRDAAFEYAAYAPLPRIALYDIAYPTDAAEFGRMNGYAVMAITAVVQDSLELPLTHVYLRTPTEDTALPLVGIVRSHMADTAIEAVFGRHRADAVYLIPVNRGAGPVELLVDFAANRQGFRLEAFGGGRNPSIQHLPKSPAGSEYPELVAIMGMVMREFPELGAIIQ